MDIYPPKARFFEQHAEAAMRQQQMYGIPASITLAQMYLESGGGTSALALKGKNFFGIKCPKGWVESGKPYGLHTDDRPNEKFCYYDNVDDSIQHHSELLMGQRYSKCQALESTDYVGWANGLKDCGYATAKNYATSLIGDIKKYRLDLYDKMAVENATQPIGYMRGKTSSAIAVKKTLEPLEGHWAMPMDTDKMVLTCEYGDTKYHKNPHKGIDLRAKVGTPVYATEDSGLVSKLGFDKNGGGKFVRVEYTRPDGSKYEVEYLHLDKISVTQYETVNAGQVLGASGNTGRSTGPHLDFRIMKNGEWIDPKDYLAEIAVRGDIDTTLVDKSSGKELLAQLKEGFTLGNAAEPAADQTLLAQQKPVEEPSEHQTMDDDWLSKLGDMNDPLKMLAFLMGQGCGGNGMGFGGGDLISNLVSVLFAQALAMAGRGSGPTQHVVSNQAKEKQEVLTPEQEREAATARDRETIDPQRAKQLAMMNFDCEYPEAGENRNISRSMQI